MITTAIIDRFFKKWPERNSDDRIFISENDLVLSFAFFVKQQYNDAIIKFEYPFQIKYKEIVSSNTNEKLQYSYVDLIVKLHGVTVGFEFKYFTSKLLIENPHFKFELKDQVARDILRFGFRKDIHRLEYLKDKKGKGNVGIDKGFAILLTNDDLLINTVPNDKTLDSHYRFSESAPIKGDIEGWLKKDTHPKWVQQKQFNISLPLRAQGYPVVWHDYITYESDVKNRVFKYCVIEV